MPIIYRFTAPSSLWAALERCTRTGKADASGIENSKTDDRPGGKKKIGVLYEPIIT